MCALFKDFGKLHNLLELNLKYTFINDSILSDICEMLVVLKVLNIRGCTNVTDTGLAHLIKLKSLEELDISGCFKITNYGLRHLGALITLKKT